MQLIDIEDVSIKYGDLVALQGANLKIYDRDFIGIIGPNGGGKTSFVKAIFGLVKISSGRITRAVDSLTIGYLPQVATIDKAFPMTVVNVVCSGVNASLKKTRAKAMELLKMAGVEDKATNLISELSGGQMQRVMLCRALIQDPKLLILDEPTTYVDNNFSHGFYELLHELNKDIAILMVSHDLGMITQHVKTIACVNKSFHYHNSNIIDQHQLKLYGCPMQLVSHGNVPHTVLGNQCCGDDCCKMP